MNNFVSRKQYIYYNIVIFAWSKVFMISIFDISQRLNRNEKLITSNRTKKLQYNNK